jgi:hypothetical protein
MDKKYTRASTRRGELHRTPAKMIAENPLRPWGTGIITIEGVKLKMACWSRLNRKGERYLKMDVFYADGETKRLVGYDPITTTTPMEALGLKETLDDTANK